MTSIHHDIVFRKQKTKLNAEASGMADGLAISQGKVPEVTKASAGTRKAALATGQFAFVNSEQNNMDDDEAIHRQTAGQPSRRLLGSNLYSAFRKKSSQVESMKEATGIVFIPSQISLREGSLISDLQDAYTHESGAKSNRHDRPGDKETEINVNPRLFQNYAPTTRPNRRSSFGSIAPEQPKLRELIQDSGILDEMQKYGFIQPLLEDQLWRPLSKNTNRAVSTVIKSTLQEVLSLEDHPSFYSSASRKAMASMNSNSNGSTNEFLSYGDTTLSSRSLDGLQHYYSQELQDQKASFEPDSDSARPLPHLPSHMSLVMEPTKYRQAFTSRSLSISSRYEPTVSPIPDGVELDVLPTEFNNSFLYSHRRDPSDDLQNSDFLLTEEQLNHLNRKDSTYSIVSEITMDTNVKTSGRSVLTTPPATPMILDPRAPQLLMAKLQSDPNTEIDAVPRPPMAMDSPAPPMRKRSPDDDQVIEDVFLRAGTRAGSVVPAALRPYARKGTLPQSTRQMYDMGAIAESVEKVGASKIINQKSTENDGADSDLDSESEDPPPISLRGPFANDSDAAPIKLGGLLIPQHDSNPLLFPAPLISDDEDEEGFGNETELAPRVRPKPVHRELFNAATATPSIDNTRKGLSKVFVAAKQQKPGIYQQDIVFDSSNSSVDLESELAPLQDGNPKSGTSALIGQRNTAKGIEPSSTVGQFRQLNCKSTFRYPKPPSKATAPDMRALEKEVSRMKVEENRTRSDAKEDIDDASSVESADLPPASLRGPFAGEAEGAPLPLGNLLEPKDDVNPLLFPAPLLSDDDDDEVYFEDQSLPGALSPPVSTFVPPPPLDAPIRSSFQNPSEENSRRDILFDASVNSTEFDPESQTNENEIILVPPHSKINSSVVADGQVYRTFRFQGLVKDDNDCVRVKLCPARIAYLLDGKAHVHPGYYSGPLNSDCRMHGNGMFWFTSGDTYLGQFRNGELHGAGMMSVTDDETGKKQVFSGYFSHNKYVGDEMIDDDSTGI